MKPFEDVFASDIFRHVVLPGIVLSVGFHPLISPWIPGVTNLYGIGPTALIVAEVIALGLGISSAIQWIYYVYEGFRVEWVTSMARQINRTRVERGRQRRRNIQAGRDFNALSSSEQSEVTEIYEYLRDFPLRRREDGSVEHFAERPTRLGNIIATYELYAESRYGIDGTYFWNHFLNLASDATRKAFEDKYSFAESLVLASFAGALVAILHSIVLLGFAVGTLFESLIFFHPASGPATSGWLLLFGVIVWLLFYQASLPAHRDVGAGFCAIIDSAIPKFIDWANAMKVPPSGDTVKKIEELTDYLKESASP